MNTIEPSFFSRPKSEAPTAERLLARSNACGAGVD
jgi:hypothetical protein